MLACLSALAVSAAASGVAAGPAGAVTGGRLMPVRVLRSAVEVVTGTRLCSGVLIAPRIALLALHCQAGRGSHVRVGNPNRGGLMQARAGVSAVPAPQEQPPPAITGDTDVEALVLNRPVAPRPVEVESSGDSLALGLDETPILIAGFGKASAGARTPRVDRVRLREAGMVIKSCFGLVATADGSPFVSCAVPARPASYSVTGGSPCAGDSGGPVEGITADGRVVLTGVISGGARSECASGTPVVYTPLAPLLSWTSALAAAPLPPATAAPRYCRGDRRQLAARTRTVARLRARARHHRHDRSLAAALRTARARRQNLADRVYVSC